MHVLPVRFGKIQVSYYDYIPRYHGAIRLQLSGKDRVPGQRDTVLLAESGEEYNPTHRQIRVIKHTKGSGLKQPLFPEKPLKALLEKMSRGEYTLSPSVALQENNLKSGPVELVNPSGKPSVTIPKIIRRFQRILSQES